MIGEHSRLTARTCAGILDGMTASSAAAACEGACDSVVFSSAPCRSSSCASPAVLCACTLFSERLGVQSSHVFRDIQEFRVVSSRRPCLEVPEVCGIRRYFLIFLLRERRRKHGATDVQAMLVSSLRCESLNVVTSSGFDRACGAFHFFVLPYARRFIASAH